MVSLYTHKADTRGERDHWLRKPALVVLLYEGVVANVLDFDYAPQSELIENRRIWMNVSQVRQQSFRMSVTGRAHTETDTLHPSLQQYWPTEKNKLSRGDLLVIRTQYEVKIGEYV